MELQQDLNVTFFTDSMIVLHSLRNETKRFPVYVENRLSLILQYSDPSQCHHVPSEMNPADDASRGLTPQQLLTSSWLQGPSSFDADNPQQPEEPDAEVRAFLTSVDDIPSPRPAVDDPIAKLIAHYSDWRKLKRAVAHLLHLRDILRDIVQKKSQVSGYQVSSPAHALNAEDLAGAESCIVKWVQASVFADEVSDLQRASNQNKDQCVKKSSSLYHLDPFLHEGMLRIRGRLSDSDMEFETKHPIILPRQHWVTQLIIRDVHEGLGHAGRSHVLSAMREKFWVIAGNAAVRSVITSCVTCRRLRGPLQDQKMADLPPSRMNASAPPFSSVAVDYFGPF